MKHKLFISAVVGAVIMATGVYWYSQVTKASSSPLVFPVIGQANYSNDYLSPRGNGPHHATDIFAAKGAPVVSATNGTVVYAPYPEPSYGYMVKIRSDSGWEYNYIHLNNDTPGTDDGRGGAMNAYAPGIKPGERVRKGQLIGWVGDSGNAENTPPHLHFERYKPDGKPTNPYYTLRNSPKLRTPAIAVRQADEILPNGERKDGVNVDVGNFAGDENREVVTGLAKSPRVSVYNRLNSRMYTFLAYAEGFRGGVDVAAGDVDGDGYDEIITGPGKGGGPRVRIFEADGTHIKDLWVHDRSFKGGIQVSAGDIDGDGVDEVVIGLGPGSEPRVKAYKLDGTVVADFLAGRAGYRGGVDVAAANVQGDNRHEIITSYLKTGGPYVKIFTREGQTLRTITPYSTSYLGGLRLSAGELRGGYSKIAVVPATNYVSLVKVYNGDGSRLFSRYYVEEWWRGSYDIALSRDVLKGATGVNRRDSVRDVSTW